MSRLDTPRSDGGFYPRVFGLATAGLLAYAVFRILRPFLGSLLWAVLLAFLLFPLNRRLRRAFGGRRGGAALALTLGVTLLVLLPAAGLTVAFATQATELVARLQAAAGRYDIVGASDLLRLPVLDRATAWVGRLVPVTPEQVDGWIVDASKTLLQTLVSVSGAVFTGALSVMVGLVLTLFLLFFFLRDGEEMARRLLLLVPLAEERKASLTRHLAAVTQAVVLGALLTSVVQGALVGIAFLFVGLPSPVVFGVLAAVASLLPLVGTALVWGPGAIALAVQGRWTAAVVLVAWGAVVVAGADNVVRPLMITGRAQVSTLTVFLGLMGGLGAFGPIGMFLGPVVLALVVALLRFAEESRAGESPVQPPEPGP